MKQTKLLVSIFLGSSLLTHAYALPFSIVPNSPLPTFIVPNASTPASASYTITNVTKFNPPSNKIKSLPANVSINPEGTTCTPTSGFQLAPGQSCVLNLNVMGNVNRNDPNISNHLLVCMSDNVTCAGPSPQNSLNVISVTSWINALSLKGYHTAQGNVFLMENTDCPEFVAVFDSCFGQNPAAPYIIPQPPIEQSYVDPYYATQFETPGPDGMTDIFYRLGDHDALITIFSYPPKAAYMGYQSYVFTRLASDYEGITPPRARTVSPNPSRYEVVGSIGNDINNIIVENQGGVPWGGQTIMFITTSNQYLAHALIENATAVGIDPTLIFIEPIGSNVITGNDASADDMVTLSRYAIPEDSTASSTWTDALSQNVLVYKVSNDRIPISRYGENQYTAHSINNSELSLTSALEQLAQLLQVYLTEKQHIPSSYQPTVATTTVTSSGVPDTGLVGSFCIYYGTNCEADNQDTSTYSFLALKILGPEETAFIAGVNHSVVDVINNNRYVSVDIYNAANSSGVASASQTNPAAVGFDSGNLTGSAQNVLEALGIVIPPTPDYNDLRENIAKLYVTFIARNCDNSTISAAKDYCINLMGTSLIPAFDPISVTERSYILPGTTTGGNVDYMVYPYVIAATADFQ